MRIRQQVANLRNTLRHQKYDPEIKLTMRGFTVTKEPTRVQESRQHHSTADTNSALFIRVRRNQLPSNQSLVKKNHIRRLRNWEATISEAEETNVSIPDHLHATGQTHKTLLRFREHSKDSVIVACIGPTPSPDPFRCPSTLQRDTNISSKRCYGLRKATIPPGLQMHLLASNVLTRLSQDNTSLMLEIQ